MRQIIELVILYLLGPVGIFLGVGLIAIRRGPRVRAFFGPLMRRSSQNPASAAAGFGIATVLVGGLILASAIAASIGAVQIPK